jgi:hypothetical protein
LGDNSPIARETANKFARELRNEENLVKLATGQKKRSLSDVMSPSQQRLIDNTLKDLQRAALADDLMKAKGSDTAQNLLADNFVQDGGLGSLASRMATNRVMDRGTANAVTRPLIAPIEDKLQGLLADAVLDPTLAAKLMKKARDKEAARGLLSDKSWLLTAPMSGLLLSE